MFSKVQKGNMENPTKPTRRDFIQTAIAVSGVGVVSSLIGLHANAESRAKKADAAAEPKCVPGKGMAGTMNYYPKHADVKEASQKQTRSGVPWEKQFCHNCSLFTPSGKGEGKCSVITGCTVEADGICTTWTEKKA